MRSLLSIPLLLRSGLAATVLLAATLPGHSQRLPVQNSGEPRPVPVYELIDCLNLALKQNPQILIAAKRIEEAEGAKIEARAGFIPSLTASGGFFHRERDYASSNDSNPFRRNEDWSVNIRLTQNLYSGGGVRARMAIAKLAADSRLHDYQTAVERTTLDVRIAFYQALLAQANLEVRRQAVELLRAQLASQKSRLAAGTVARLNVLRAEVALANELPSLIEAENDAKNSLLRLSELMAIPLDVRTDTVPFTIRGELDYRPVDVNLQDCLAKAEELRPELRARGNDIRLAENQWIVDRSEILPRISIFGGYDVLSETDRRNPDDTIGGYIAGITGTWNIFDGFSSFGKMKASRARQAAAEFAYDSQKLAILAEVRSAWLQLQQAQATVESQIKNTAIAEESYKLVEASFDAGLSSQLDILQGRVDLTRSRLNELNARFLHKSALARLQRSISGGIRLVFDEQPATP